MGHRTRQRILECGKCERTPGDGEYLWEMCGEYWCKPCCEVDQFLREEEVKEGISENSQKRET